MHARLLRSGKTFVTIFVTVFAACIVVPMVLGMTQSNSKQEHLFAPFGIDVFDVTTDGTGGFATTYGPGVLLLPLVLAVLLATIPFLEMLFRNSLDDKRLP